jgi:hypothetical protein
MALPNAFTHLFLSLSKKRGRLSGGLSLSGRKRMLSGRSAPELKRLLVWPMMPPTFCASINSLSGDCCFQDSYEGSVSVAMRASWAGLFVTPCSHARNLKRYRSSVSQTADRTCQFGINIERLSARRWKIEASEETWGQASKKRIGEFQMQRRTGSDAADEISYFSRYSEQVPSRRSTSNRNSIGSRRVFRAGLVRGSPVR